MRPRGGCYDAAARAVMVDYNVAKGLPDRRLLPPTCNEHNLIRLEL